MPTMYPDLPATTPRHWLAPPQPLRTGTPAMQRGLPRPAQRWLRNAVSPWAPGARSAQLKMHGEIKFGGRWASFVAREVLVPGSGYVWAARARLRAGLTVRGYDSYLDGIGEMHWRALGIVPVASAAGSDVSASAAGRLAAEAVLLPTSLLGARWEETGDAATATYHQRIGDHDHPVTVTVDAEGRLVSAAALRWGDPEGTGYRQCPFTVRFDGQLRFDGIAVPHRLQASWGGDADFAAGEFFRAVIDDVEFR